MTQRADKTASAPRIHSQPKPQPPAPATASHAEHAGQAHPTAGRAAATSTPPAKASPAAHKGGADTFGRTGAEARQAQVQTHSPAAHGAEVGAAAPASPLQTVADREEIGNALGAFNHSIDDASRHINDPKAYAAAREKFMGLWSDKNPVMQWGQYRMEGKDAIGAFFDQHVRSNEPDGAQGKRHFDVNPEITRLDANSASVSSDLEVKDVRLHGLPTIASGRYTDEMVKENGRWVFAQRSLDIDPGTFQP